MQDSWVVSFSEVFKEPILIPSVKINKRPGSRVGVQPVIRFEQPETFGDILEIHIVELVRSHDVVKDRDGRIFRVTRASLLQRLRESGVIPGTVPAHQAHELFTMRESDRVSSAESDHFLNGEASGLELANGLGHRRRREREEVGEEGGFGGTRVAAAEVNRVVRTADGDEEVAGGDGDDVGAGDVGGQARLDGGGE
ncbi:hypothetical protein F2Q69_00039612 [Brassica cretica]|uniref:Uncharacterized protein n=1 Tax=Brassica cretica TaxID=69181 RepID=A0A8S9NFI4_BRACR|nr:hypothetical protein F2Q69_00039612 [Brassica cretica]